MNLHKGGQTPVAALVPILPGCPAQAPPGTLKAGGITDPTL